MAEHTQPRPRGWSSPPTEGVLGQRRRTWRRMEGRHPIHCRCHRLAAAVPPQRFRRLQLGGGFRWSTRRRCERHGSRRLSASGSSSTARGGEAAAASRVLWVGCCVRSWIWTIERKHERALSCHLVFAAGVVHLISNSSVLVRPCRSCSMKSSVVPFGMINFSFRTCTSDRARAYLATAVPPSGQHDGIITNMRAWILNSSPFSIESANRRNVVTNWWGDTCKQP